jgi:hypothetical protein
MGINNFSKKRIIVQRLVLCVIFFVLLLPEKYWQSLKELLINGYVSQ